MESESYLETGKHTFEDRAHRLVPCDQTDAEKDAEQTWCRQTFEGRSKEYHLDEEESFQFLCDRGSE
eukprot:8873679-Heterocapsa_arctica.AAC.1